MTVYSKYDRVAVGLHWIVALLMIFMVVFGEELMDDEAGSAAGASWHASIGSAILLLSAVRVIWRLANPPPPLPSGMKGWEITASYATHGLFYALMFALPLTGLMGFALFAQEEPIMSNASLFGLLPVPQFTLIEGWEWDELHEILSKLMYPLIALHVLAALKHQFINKDGLLKRMT